MSRFSVVRWLQMIEHRFRRTPRKRQARAGLRPARFMPRLEALEDRTLPSTFLVTNLNDSGAGSLRAAVQSADATSGAVIDFAAGLHGTITLTSGQLNVTSNMTIDGSGANKLTVSGNNASRVFDIGNSATATIAGLTIADGATVGDEATPATLGGGGILNEAGSTLTLTSCVVAGNTATAANDTVDVFGGGLLNEGTAVVDTCTFRGNQALGGGGTSFFGGSVGGGIDNFGGATLTVMNSSFSNNQALGAGSGSFGIGGAIENNAGLNNTAASTASITGCTFTGNMASGSAGVLGNGGALDNEGTGASMTVSSSTFLDNQSVGASGGTAANGIGGAIMNYDNSTVTVTDSLFSGNQALGSGSGGSGQGGAIVNDGAFPSTMATTTTITNCTFTGNVAGGVAGSVDVTGYGGALINNSHDNGNLGKMTVRYSTIAANTASNGGGIADVDGGLVTLNNTIVATNMPGDLWLDAFQNAAYSGSNDLIGDGSEFVFTNSLKGNPLLAPLGNYGGPTQTMALLLGSPAIGAGTAIPGITTDQRGFSRPTSNPDIGAFQFQNVHLDVTVTPLPATAVVGTPVTFLITVRDAGATALPADGSTLTVTTSGGLSAGGPLTFAVGPLASGQSQTFSFNATGVGLGVQTITASVTSVDTNPATVPTSATVNIVPQTPPPPPPPAPPTPAPPPPFVPPSLKVPPLLAFFDALLGGIETVNADRTETIVDRFFGFPLVVATFDSSGNFVSAALFGITLPNWVWNL